jgi:MoaA/NifB/PqqE/SkfB family radical SAM enzyme
MDGKLLLFERDTGLNILMEGEEVAHLRRAAPRTLLIAVTNHCNLTCDFCYRDLDYPSAWTYESLLAYCQQAAEWGVLEVAFGGGEPTVFPRWADFIDELYATTPLGINFTTNGTLLTPELLQRIRSKVGQIRLSLYDTNDWQQTIPLLAASGVRFGVNWLIHPAMLPDIERTFAHLLALGVRDFLLIGYKGADPAMHLTAEQHRRFEAFVQKVYQRLGDTVRLKLDVCWGDSLGGVPRLFDEPDCGAGDGFISITSHKHIKPCSFHHWTVPAATLADVRQWWQANRAKRQAAWIGGCARLQDRGLTPEGGVTNAFIDLAAVE